MSDDLKHLVDLRARYYEINKDLEEFFNSLSKDKVNGNRLTGAIVSSRSSRTEILTGLDEMIIHKVTDESRSV
jgi:hypothetical protein